MKKLVLVPLFLINATGCYGMESNPSGKGNKSAFGWLTSKIANAKNGVTNYLVSLVSKINPSESAIESVATNLNSGLNGNTGEPLRFEDIQLPSKLDDKLEELMSLNKKYLEVSKNLNLSEKKDDNPSMVSNKEVVTQDQETKSLPQSALQEITGQQVYALERIVPYLIRNTNLTNKITVKTIVKIILDKEDALLNVWINSPDKQSLKKNLKECVKSVLKYTLLTILLNLNKDVMEIVTDIWKIENKQLLDAQLKKLDTLKNEQSDFLRQLIPLLQPASTSPKKNLEELVSWLANNPTWQSEKKSIELLCMEIATLIDFKLKKLKKAEQIKQRLLVQTRKFSTQ